MDQSCKIPVNEFLDSLPFKHAQKVKWVLELIEKLDQIPVQYFKKLKSTKYIWEVRVRIGSNSFRLLGFINVIEFVIQMNGFSKKSQKTPKHEIDLAQNNEKSTAYLVKEKQNMSDLQAYISERKKSDPEFAEGYEEGFRNFKIGVLLKQARERAGLTQAQVAKQLNTKKTAVSRIENHAEDIRLSTLEKYAKAFGKKLRVELVD